MKALNMFYKLSLCLSVVICMTRFGAYAQDVAFFSVLPDVPVMAGMVEAQNMSVLYDKPQGRFVEVLAVGKGDTQAVGVYYSDVLPQMGWRLVTGSYFVRGDERLDITVDDMSASESVMKITVSPILR